MPTGVVVDTCMWVSFSNRPQSVAKKATEMVRPDLMYMFRVHALACPGAA